MVVAKSYLSHKKEEEVATDEKEEEEESEANIFSEEINNINIEGNVGIVRKVELNQMHLTEVTMWGSPPRGIGPLLTIIQIIFDCPKDTYEMFGHQKDFIRTNKTKLTEMMRNYNFIGVTKEMVETIK